MSNDIFVREVNEELRQDRVRALWIRYGSIAVVVAVAIVAAVGGYVLWQRYQAGLQAADGDRLISASTLIAEGKGAEARTVLDGLVAQGTGVYPVLARLRIADSLRAEDPAGAVARFDEVAGDAAAPQGLRDMAAVRAAYILVDTGSLADVRGRVERLTGDGEALRYPAREAVGLAAWKAGEADTARTLFTQLQDDLGTPSGIKRRAGLMLELIAAATPAAPASVETPAAAATEPAPAADVPAAASPAQEAPAPAPAAQTPALAPAAPAPVAPTPDNSAAVPEPATPDAAPAPTETPAAGSPADPTTAAPQPPA